MPDDSTVVCVLGAPRSGTSLTARVLNLIGVDLGPEEQMLEAGPGNPLWECRRFVELNDRILDKLGGAALAPPVPKPGWEQSDIFAAERADARRLLDETFSGTRLWGWKDPRTCLTLPFWQRLVPGLRYVICVRSPLDSVASTLRHTSISREQALRIWLVYVASALANTVSGPRTFVSYEAYFAGRDSQVKRLARFAGRDVPTSGTPAAGLIESLVEQRLWHHRSPLGDGLDNPDLIPAITPLFLILQLSTVLAAGAGDDGAADGRSLELSESLGAYARRLLDGIPSSAPAPSG